MKKVDWPFEFPGAYWVDEKEEDVFLPLRLRLSYRNTTELFKL
jgi:hypothetical protein